MALTEIICDWQLVTGPTQEPITLDEAKAQARVTGDDENDVLMRFIKTARGQCERFMARGLYTQTWKLGLSDWADAIPLPMAAPLQNDSNANPSTAPVIQYYDGDGVLQTLSTSVYGVDTLSRPGQIVRASGQTWPSLDADRTAPRIEITYVVGWTRVADIPEDIKQGLRLYVTYLDCDRDGQGEYGAQAMLAAQRCWGDRVTWSPPACRA